MSSNNKQKHQLKALTILRNNSKERPEILLRANLLATTHQLKKAQNLLKQLAVNAPQSEAISIALAEVYIASNQAQKAWKILERIKVSEQTSLLFFETMQKAARLTQKASLVYFTSAQHNLRISKYNIAKTQLKRAIKLRGNDKNHYKMQKMLSLLNNLIKP